MRTFDLSNFPGNSIIFRDRDSPVAVVVIYEVGSSAPINRHIDRAIRRDLDVTVDSSALVSSPDWDCWAKGPPAIQTERAIGVSHILSAVLQCMWGEWIAAC